MRIIGNDPSVPRQTQEVASGTLPNGRPVVVNSNGTVSVVSGSGSPSSVGSQTTFESGATERMRYGAAFDANNNRVVFVYKDDANSDYGTAVAGTVSGTSITFGTPVVYSSINTDRNAATFCGGSVNKVLIAYYKNNVDTTHTRVVNTSSSDNSITLGNESGITEVAGVNYMDLTFDSNANKVVYFYKVSSQGKYMMGSVATDGEISLGSEGTFTTNSPNYLACTFDSNLNRTVVLFTDDSDNSNLKCRVGSTSGSTLSFGSITSVASDRSNGNGMTFDSNSNKVVIVYRDIGNSFYGTAVVGTISGTSISFGTPVVFSQNNIGNDTEGPTVAFDSTNNKIAVAFEHSSELKLISGTVSGTSITFDSELTVDTGNPGEIMKLVYDDNADKFVVGYSKVTTRAGVANVVQIDTQSTNLTSENYIGMSRGAVIFNSATEAIGSEAVFESATTSLICAAYDSNENKTVIVYRDQGNSNYGTAVVATVSGNSISYGTPVVFEAATTGHTSVAFDSNSNKIVIAYADTGNSNYGTAIVGTVSGTSISFGTPVVYNAGTTAYNNVVFDSSSNKIVISYQDTSNSSHGTAIVGTVSGTSISFGSETVFESAETAYISAAFDSNSNKVVIAYQDVGNSFHGTAIVGTVSGTSISFGSATVFESAAVSLVQAGFDSTNNKIVVGYYDGGNSYYGTAIVGTVSGTSISFGTAVVFQSSQSNVYSIVHDSNAQKTVIFFRDQANSQLGTVIAGTVSGTSISFDTKFVVNNGSTEGHTQNAVFDSTAKKIVIAYRDDGNSSYGTGVVYQTGFDNTIRGQVADGGHALVDTQGAISDNQSGLTAGQSYFVQTDGTIGTTADDPSVFAGTAVSATKLIVKG